MHEIFGHSFLNASGTGYYGRSPVFREFSPEEMIAAITSGELPDGQSIPLLEIREGGRQSTSLSPEELMADLIALAAGGSVSRPPAGFDAAMAASIRQAMLYHTSPQEYAQALPEAQNTVRARVRSNTTLRINTIDANGRTQVWTEDAAGNRTYYDAINLSSQNQVVTI